MWKCNNCGGQLVFDIETQSMKCKQCASFFEVRDDDIFETGVDDYEANVFTCPQCGAELSTLDTDMASFCTYCGAEVVLERRLVRQNKPSGIVPFKVTKEQARGIFNKYVGSKMFLSKDYKDEKNVDSIRGIYIPFWSYTAEVDGDIRFDYTDTHRGGNYDITEYHTKTGDCEAEFPDLLYDASTGFFDDISESLKPYDLDTEQDFKTDYLQGFYADIPDVDEKTYQVAAFTTANEALKSKLEYDTGVFVDEVHDKALIKDTGRLTLLPVWFLTYRSRDRVAYFTVNGSSGKVAADVPIDTKKVLSFAGVIWAVLFLLSQLLPVVNIDFLLSVIQSIGVFGAYFFTQAFVKVYEAYTRKHELGVIENKFSSDKVLPALSFLLWVFSLASGSGMLRLGAVVILMYVVLPKKSEASGLPLVILFAGMLVSEVLGVFVPPYDMYAYTCAGICTAGVFGCLVSTIKMHYLMSTRKLPHFDRKGGDNRAY